jgi:cytochrome P450
MTATLSHGSPVRFQLADADTWPNPWPVLSRHADVWEAARDNDTFSSAQGLTVNYGELELIGLQDNPPFVMQDPPVHTEFRKLVSRGFTPRQVEAVEPKVREFVVERIERIRASRFRRWSSRIISASRRRTAISSTAGPRRSSRPTPPLVASPGRWAVSATHSAR